MNKNLIIILATVNILVFGSIFQKIFASDSVAEHFGIKAKGSGTFIMQGISNIPNNLKNSFKDNATYVFSLKLIKEFENNGKIIAGFKGGGGLGSCLNTKNSKKVMPLAYTRINENASSTLNSYGDMLLKITELSYQHSLTNNGRFTACFGKLNFGSYFAGNEYANDDTSQFITGTFTADKTIEKPSQQHVASRLNYAFDKFDISYAYFATNIDDICAHMFGITQITYKPSKNGNYRVYAWVNNNNNYYSYKTNNLKSGTHGFGISLDQEITKTLAIFGRFGYKDPSTNIYIKKNSNIFFTPIISNMFNVGAQIKVPHKSGKSDVIGLAIGQIRGSSNLEKQAARIFKQENENPDKNPSKVKLKYKNNIETQGELYYKFVINDYIGITTSIQHIINPRGGNTDIKNKNITVCGVRISLKF
jgi:hypothetical protein